MTAAKLNLALTAFALALGLSAAQAHTQHPKPASTPGEADISDVKRTPGAGASLAAQHSKAQSYFGDAKLRSSDGRTLRFYSDVLKDRVVLINFVYTRCGDACPLVVHSLTRAKKELGEAFGRDVRFISLSIDPERDTPAQLASFARKFDATHPEWLFLSGSKGDMDALLKKLGAFTENLEEHFTGMYLGNLRTDRWRKMRPDTPPVAIAQEIRRIAELPFVPTAAK